MIHYYSCKSYVYFYSILLSHFWKSTEETAAKFVTLKSERAVPSLIFSTENVHDYWRNHTSFDLEINFASSCNSGNSSCGQSSDAWMGDEYIGGSILQGKWRTKWCMLDLIRTWAQLWNWFATWNVCMIPKSSFFMSYSISISKRWRQGKKPINLDCPYRIQKQLQEGIDNAFKQGLDYRERYVESGFLDDRMLTNQVGIRNTRMSIFTKNKSVPGLTCVHHQAWVSHCNVKIALVVEATLPCLLPETNLNNNIITTDLNSLFIGSPCAHECRQFHICTIQSVRFYFLPVYSNEPKHIDFVAERTVEARESLQSSRRNQRMIRLAISRGNAS